MVKQLASAKEHRFEWIDLMSPTEAELHELAEKYELHEASVKDALQTDHLPKFERIRNYKFIILRLYDPINDIEADTVRELTNKIAVFISDHYIITLHRYPWEALENIRIESVCSGICKESSHVLLEIVKAALISFEEPGKKLNAAIDYYEELVFLKQRKKPVLKGLYFVKRKVDVIRRLLLLTYDIVDKIDPVDATNVYSRDVRDLYIKHQNIFDALSENTNHLLNIYFNISSQRTNEIIRILTIFSVFFMPLTFIVGIYGMNFDYMPELRWHFGYPSAILIMGLIVVIIYVWFKRNKWL